MSDLAAKKESGSIAASMDRMEQHLEALRSFNEEMNDLLNQFKTEPYQEREKSPDAVFSIDERLNRFNGQMENQLMIYQDLIKRIKSWL